MIEIAALAATIVGKFLVPFAAAGAGAVGKKIAEQFGQDAADKVTEVEKTVSDEVSQLFAAGTDKAALELFKQNPKKMEEMLTELLQAKLEQNRDAAEKLDRLVNSPAAGRQTGAQIMNATYAGIVDARGATISGGTVAGVYIGRVPDPPKPKPTNPRPDPDDS